MGPAWKFAEAPLWVCGPLVENHLFINIKNTSHQYDPLINNSGFIEFKLCLVTAIITNSHTAFNVALSDFFPLILI